MPVRVQISLALACLLALGIASPLSAEETQKAPPKLEIHLRAQGWYQAVEDGASDGDGTLHDFQLRRVYLSLAGQVTPKVGLFAHLATKVTLDWTRVEQDRGAEDAPAPPDRDLVTLQVSVGL